ncbi:MAG: hypothetical protein EXQ79_00740 [Acidimicrobiia bacterium]|nr:hypothetical protein [Acidimicrobiia bacterium]
MRIRRRAAFLAVAGVMSASFLVTATPAPAGELVLPPTQSAAERVVDEYNSANDVNNAHLDIEGQAAIEGAPIKTIDDVAFHEAFGRGDTSLGSSADIDNISVFVPDQSSYPLTFLAFERFTSSDTGNVNEQFLVFAKASSDAPWKVTHAASLLPDVSVPDVATDQDGLATIVKGKGASRLQVNPTKLSPKLAKLWQNSADGVPIAKPFEPGLLTTDAAAVFLGELEQLPINESNVDFQFRSTETQPLCFASADQAALCFFVINYRATLDPVSGVYEQDDSRETLTGLVVPGVYGGVIFDRTAIVLASVPRRSKLARVDVIGLYNGLVAAEGTPQGVDALGDAV